MFICIVFIFIIFHILLYRFFKINLLNNFKLIFFFFFSVLIFFVKKINETDILFLLAINSTFVFYRFILMGVFNVGPSVFILYNSIKNIKIRELKTKFYKQSFTEKRFKINLDSNLIIYKKNKYIISCKSKIIIKFYIILNKIFNIS